MKYIRLRLSADGNVTPDTEDNTIRGENRATAVALEFPAGYEGYEKCIEFCTAEGKKYNRAVVVELNAENRYEYEIEKEFLKKGRLLLNISARKQDDNGIYRKVVRWVPYLLIVA